MQHAEGYVTTNDGIRLFFHKTGAGPRTLVFPNGLHVLEDFRYLADGCTMIFYDLRNRGLSDAVTDAAKLAKGVHHDVDDLEAVRRHFGLEQMDLMSHSYSATMVMLYAMQYPHHVRRVVVMGAMSPYGSKQYPAHLTNNDATLAAAMSKLTELGKEQLAPQELCQRFWAILKVIYVVDAANANRIKWERCNAPNEINFMTPWMTYVLPSIIRLNIPAEEFAKASMPVLVVHGTKDRSSAYGGARDWALGLPNARLLTVANAAHAPWIEDPGVFGAIRTFLEGAWPEAAEKVTSLEP